MSEMVTQINVLGNGTNIFDTDKEYIIPLYQRAYAWEDKQLIQLVEDIDDVSEETNYYIGSLIVSNQNGKYEVVDGQQRLTSLYLLLSCLDIPVKNTLTFACREKSNYALKNIDELVHENRSKLDMDCVESGIQRGITILKNELEKPKYADRSAFIRKLSKVVLFRIEVPENTDLNRYFEIMNTRGEQLEQHDILKAELISFLKDRTDENVFAKMWDACSDMSGYVQMHFISKNNEERNNLFGWWWTEIPCNKWSEYRKFLKDPDNIGEKFSINEIIKKGAPRSAEYAECDIDKRVRFESIIEFPFFLIHTLKVFIATNEIKHEDASKEIIPKLLDDKKLKETFDNVIKYGMIGDKHISDNTREFAKNFVMCLLRTRFLFDKYIVKREYANDNADGVWCIKSLVASRKKRSAPKASYKNSRFISNGQHEKTNDACARVNVMIQSAMRVSYVSPKAMHWITDALIWLSTDDCKHIKNDDITEFDMVIEEMAKDAVKELFFDKCPDGVYKMGVNTPHIVFNYLDYLLWYNNPKEFNEFTFEFRNSVEHWYPQNPSEGTFEQWKDDVDSFGNLCIIQRNVNSRFSNMAPEAKKSTFGNMISKGSLKLRIMSELTEKSSDKVASQRWKDTLYKEHETEMISILKGACGLDSELES